MRVALRMWMWWSDVGCGKPVWMTDKMFGVCEGGCVAGMEKDLL
jgi:hypothetical protein